MSTHILNNPFPSTAYNGPEYFCDREEETKSLLNNIKNGNSTTLVAIRRIGKTGLIQHVLGQLPKGWKGIYVDILDTEDLNNFLNHITSAIMNAVPEKSNIGIKFWDFIRSLRPIITFDSLTGEPQASFEFKGKETEKNINSVLHFLENQEFKTVIAIDEFQQIVNYPEKNTDAWLRTRIQQLHNVVFIFSGSQQHLMTELFTSPKRPFFRSTQMLKLEKINKEKYCNFIITMFKKYQKEIDRDLTNEILEWSDNYTFYVQQLFNRVFAATKKNVTSEIWKQEASQLLKEQESLFLGYRNMLTISQWQLLKAIAHEGKVYMPTSKQFLSTYQLSTSASILRSLKTLCDIELVYSEFDLQGEKYYSVYDVWFQRWSKLR